MTSTTTTADSASPNQRQPRRTTYRAGSAQEQFIVPLVARKIDAALKTFAAPLAASGNAKVLDIGCGEQPLRQALEAVGFTYVSADIQQNRAGNVDVIAALDRELPAALRARAPFDFVVCTEVLEHVADWDKAFRNLAGLLAPGGRVLITCPHFYHLHEIPHDYWRPTPYALQYFSRRHGLTILSQENAGDGLDVLGTALACATPAPASNSLLSRAMTFLFDLYRKASFVILRSRFVRRRVTTRGLLYLSNIAVLERPAAP